MHSVSLHCNMTTCNLTLLVPQDTPLQVGCEKI